MAFNAQQTGRARIAVIIVALVAVAGIAVALVLQLATPATTGSADASAQNAAQAQSDGSQDAQDEDVMETVDAQYGTAAQTLRTQYEADPSNPSALLNLANGYFDWGVAALNHSDGTEDEAHAREIFTNAIEYYDEYLDGNPGSKSVVVDRAICVFYTGDHDAAITALENLLADDDSFAPAWANLGMFYETDGRTDDAATAYQRAIDAAGDDDAYNVKDYAQQRLDALQASE
ncbi:tetratricopeptide repeat protein [Collinsella sp. An2]|uniref:tetratricopeptide repeat protein n=1 Tax=Collinsella sp. An2 TaxID=1965585 RepID=UPI000B39A312|nr:tetratricopeptide repeat protein [Collinsella sp. An2]OUP09513.1 hypothetical protein B5F33_04955 [Collinsella sp. An2]